MSFSLSVIILSPGIATSIMIAVLPILVTTKISSLLFKMILSHCIFMSHIRLWLTPFSLTVWGLCRYHFSDFSRLNFSNNFQWTILATLPCIFCILSGLVLSIPHDMTNCFACFYKKVNQHSYQCGVWHSLFLMLVLVQSISGPYLVFSNFIFSTREIYFAVSSGISLINCSYNSLSFQFSTLFSLSDFFKSFLKILFLIFKILTWFTPWRKFSFEFLRFHFFFFQFIIF